MTDEERVKLITQIASNFGISCDDASYIVKSFENLGKEFMMSEADKMFDKLGYSKYEFDTYIDYLSRETSKGITFRKDMYVIDSHCGIGSEYITMQELQAINQKCKELRWIE